mgnify:CR=1 FL=1
MGLTAKQEAFCIEYVKGGSKSFSDAYRAACSVCSFTKSPTATVVSEAVDRVEVSEVLTV